MKRKHGHWLRPLQPKRLSSTSEQGGLRPDNVDDKASENSKTL